MLGHRIKSTGTEGLAAQDALKAKPGSFKRAVFGDGFERVLAARWKEATGRRQRPRQRQLIQTDQACQRAAEEAVPDAGACWDGFEDGFAILAFVSSHKISSLTCRMRTPLSPRAFCAMSTKSQPAGSTSAAASARSASRISRRARLRCTAPPTAFDVIRPMRVPEVREPEGREPESREPEASAVENERARAAFKAHNLPRQRAPSLRTRSNSAVFCSRPSVQAVLGICAPIAAYLLPWVPRLLFSGE